MRTQRPRIFVGDFETTVYSGQTKTEVWAAACVELYTEDVVILNSIEEMYNYLCGMGSNVICYFHNLKFDGEFIIYWALTHGFTHVSKKEDIKENTFTTLISDMRSILYNNIIF